MAKEFDIYLNKHLTECDLIVYSIPYRDGMTAMERLILQSCLDSYLLQKFIAVETDSELVSRIDDTLKTCFERINTSAVIDTSADFTISEILYPAENIIELYNNADLTAVSFAAADNALEIISAVQEVTTKNAQVARNDIEVDSNIVGEHIEKNETIIQAVSILTEVVEDFLTVIETKESTVTISTQASAILRRYRYLFEMDDGLLSAFDDTALDDVDFILIQE